MSTTKFKALAICFLAAFLRLTAFGQTATTSELLQKRIYLQETVGDLHSSAFVTLRVFPHEAGDFTPEQLRSEVEKSLAENKIVTVRPENWRTWQIAGHAAASCMEDLPRYRQVRYQAWVRTGASAADMFADADPQSLNALRPTFDAIIDSLVIK